MFMETKNKFYYQVFNTYNGPDDKLIYNAKKYFKGDIEKLCYSCEVT